MLAKCEKCLLGQHICRNRELHVADDKTVLPKTFDRSAVCGFGRAIQGMEDMGLFAIKRAMDLEGRAVEHGAKDVVAGAGQL